MRRTVAVAALAISSACTKPAPTASPVPTKDPNPESAETLPSPVQPQWSVFALPYPVDPALFVPPGGRFSVRSLARPAPYRAALDGDAPRVAAEFAAPPIEGRVVADSTLLIATDGTLFGSDASAGPLSVLEDLPRTTAAGMIGATVYGLAPDGTMWRQPADGKATTVRKGVLDIATHGGALYVLQDDGALLRTDADASAFTPMMDGSCISDLAYRGDGVVAKVDGTWRFVDPVDGATDDAVWAGRDAVVAHYRRRARLAALSRLADGTAVVAWGDTLLHPETGAALGSVAEGCSLEVVGAFAYQTCPVRPDELHAVAAVSRWSAGRWVAIPVEFDDRTLSLGTDGWVVGQSAETSEWYVSGGESGRTERIESEAHDHASDRFELFGSWHVFANNSTTHAVNLAEPKQTVELSPRWFDEWLRSTMGGAYGRARPVRPARRRYEFSIGDPGSGLRTVSLPETAKAVAMASLTHGMAVGDDASQLWVTTDGGTHWVRPVLPVRGDLAAVELGESVECTNAACRSGAFVWADLSLLSTPLPDDVRIVAPAEYGGPPPPARDRPCGDTSGRSTSKLVGSDQAIQCKVGGDCTIDLAWLRAVTVTGPVKLPRVVPSMKDGVSQGIKVYGIRRGTLAKLLGFKNGDLIRRVDGTDFDADQLVVVGRRLLEGGTFKVEFERKGKSFARTYIVVEGAQPAKP